MTDSMTRLLVVTALCVFGLGFSIYTRDAPQFASGLLMGFVLCACIFSAMGEK